MKKIFLLLLFFSSLMLNAQTETQIKTHYQDINKKITESTQQGYQGPLYCNEWTTNKNGKSWPAVGTYRQTTEFWYNDDPAHIPAKERNPLNVLEKINITTTSSALTTNEEFLFLNGKLVFYYKHEGEEGLNIETRLYFNAKGLFKSSVKANGSELSAADFQKEEFKLFRPDAVAVMKLAKDYQALFVKSM